MRKLWVPKYAGELLTVSIDPNQSGETEWSAMVLVNQAAFDWVAGKLDTGTYCDILEHAGIDDPLTLIQKAESYLDQILGTP